MRRRVGSLYAVEVGRGAGGRGEAERPSWQCVKWLRFGSGNKFYCTAPAARPLIRSSCRFPLWLCVSPHFDAPLSNKYKSPRVNAFSKPARPRGLARSAVSRVKLRPPMRSARTRLPRTLSDFTVSRDSVSHSSIEVWGTASHALMSCVAITITPAVRAPCPNLYKV